MSSHDQTPGGNSTPGGVEIDLNSTTASTRLPNFNELDWRTDVTRNSKKEESMWDRDWERAVVEDVGRTDKKLVQLIGEIIEEQRMGGVGGNVAPTPGKSPEESV